MDKEIVHPWIMPAGNNYYFEKGKIRYLDMYITMLNTEAGIRMFSILMRIPELETIAKFPAKLNAISVVRQNLEAKIAEHFEEADWEFDIHEINEFVRLATEEITLHDRENVYVANDGLRYIKEATVKIAFTLYGQFPNPNEKITKIFYEVTCGLNKFFDICETCGYKESFNTHTRSIDNVVYNTCEICSQLTDKEFLRGLNHEV